jgi:hypothetical protein
MAEELAVEEGIAERRGVEGDERSRGAAGRVVNGARQHGLAGPGLAQDEDGRSVRAAMRARPRHVAIDSSSLLKSSSV